MAEDAGLERVGRMKRKSPVSGVDMEFFFGKPLRGKARINRQRRTCRYEDEGEDEDDHSDGDDDDDEWEEMTTPMEVLAHRPRKTPVGGDLGLPLELLEIILSHLPTLDLVVATGVNMTFRNLVQNSPTLQRKLFLRPTNKPREFVKRQGVGRVAVATQREFDNGFDGDDNENENGGVGHNNDDDDDNLDQSSEPEWVMAYEIAALCPLLVPQCDHEGRDNDASAYEGPRVVCLSRLASLAEHWANMYLTNPPSTQVSLDLTYHGGYARQYSVSERYTVSCETGITLASLLDVIYLKGNIVVARKPGLWPSSVHGDMVGLKRNVTVNQVIAELEQWWAGQEWGCMMGKMELDLYQTTLEFPELVYREWDASSDNCYFRFSDGNRQYQTTALEKATDSVAQIVSEEYRSTSSSPNSSKQFGKHLGERAKSRSNE
jgi:hypothetical protein